MVRDREQSTVGKDVLVDGERVLLLGGSPEGWMSQARFFQLLVELSTRELPIGFLITGKLGNDQLGPSVVRPRPWTFAVEVS